MINEAEEELESTLRHIDEIREEEHVRRIMWLYGTKYYYKLV